ncbi:VENN motif pre-toxin domain-containing protein, partial [Type-E symbiont of Plautia stali]|uniref:VENN motif pre-toxin domain-containing protein n=1 Tax=Type-E symbiont of Plautia stali TaxID=1560357 RepID=UPI000A82F3F4
LSLSKSKVNSEYASVGDQSGLFAGDGGYNIFVGNHTQLNGAVIASTADAANNKLSTGTLGWDSIDNHAEYSANSTSVGINMSSSGQQFAGGALPAVVNMHESASGTTRSAVADGAITVRDVQNQKQDVAGLSRDTENANGSIGKIFDKEKVANQMAFAQGVQELAGKVVGDVKAYKLDAAEKEASDRLLKEHPDYANLSKDEFNARVQSDPSYKAVADLWGTGGTYSMVATAVAGALGGLSANNLGAAAGGAMAPYIANAIKQATTSYDAQGNPQTNVLANTMAHAVAGAVLAQISGNSAAAGASGAAGGELAARAIVKVMYPDTDISSLTENQKQIVSSLSQLAAGLAGGIASDSSMGIGAGAGAGKNAVENNALCSTVTCLANPVDAGKLTPGGGGLVGAAIGVAAGTAIAESLKDDDDKDLPNVGKDKSPDEKLELGGTGSSTPGGWGPEDEENGRQDKNSTTVDELISSSDKGRDTTGRSKLFERSGGNDAANREFNSLNPTDVRDIPGGRVGKLSDGRNVIVRENSSDGRPTLEIQSGKNRIKFRYGE